MEEEKKWEMPALVSEVEDEEKEWGTEKWDSAGKRDVQYPKIPVYCGACSLPPEYCGNLVPKARFEACWGWLSVNAPTLYPDLGKWMASKKKEGLKKKKEGEEGKRAFVRWCDIPGLSPLKTILSKSQDLPNRIVYRGKIKLHGSNASVMVTKEGTVFAQRRNGIVPSNCQEKDSDSNFGFGPFVYKQREYWKSIKQRLNCENVVVFGEWCGRKIMHGAAVCSLPSRYFAIFSILVDQKFAISDPTTIAAVLNMPIPASINVTLSATREIDEESKHTELDRAEAKLGDVESQEEEKIQSKSNHQASVATSSKPDSDHFSAMSKPSGSFDRKGEKSLGAISTPSNMFIVPYLTPSFTLDYAWLPLHNSLAEKASGKAQLQRTVDSINSLIDDIDRVDPLILQLFGIKGVGEGVVFYPESGERVTYAAVAVPESSMLGSMESIEFNPSIALSPSIQSTSSTIDSNLVPSTSSISSTSSTTLPSDSSASLPSDSSASLPFDSSATSSSPLVPTVTTFDLQINYHGFQAIPFSLLSNLIFKAKGKSHRVMNSKEAASIDSEVATSVQHLTSLFVTPQRCDQGFAETSLHLQGTFKIEDVVKFTSWMVRDVKKESTLEIGSLDPILVDSAVKTESEKWFLAKMDQIGLTAAPQ